MLASSATEERKYPEKYSHWAAFQKRWEHGMIGIRLRGGPAMKTWDHYEADVLLFFDGKPLELSLYEALFRRMEIEFPDISAKVQKSQISFYGRHLFGAASLPARRKSWPEHCIVVTIGLSYKLESPRVAVAVEPYPNRWTHHVLVSKEEQIDDELLGWLREAYKFTEAKR